MVALKGSHRDIWIEISSRFSEGSPRDIWKDLSKIFVKISDLRKYLAEICGKFSSRALEHLIEICGNISSRALKHLIEMFPFVYNVSLGSGTLPVVEKFILETVETVETVRGGVLSCVSYGNGIRWLAHNPGKEVVGEGYATQRKLGCQLEMGAFLSYLTLSL